MKRFIKYKYSVLQFYYNKFLLLFNIVFVHFVFYLSTFYDNIIKDYEKERTYGKQ